VRLPKLRAWAIAASGVPEWLFNECYDAVGDFAETVALLVDASSGTPEPQPTAPAPDRSLTAWIEEVLLPLRAHDEATQQRVVTAAWRALPPRERFIWNKLITGAFRVGVSQRLVTRALAAVSGIDDATIAHRLMGTWEPGPAFYAALLATETADADASRPYPFCLAHQLDGDPAELGPISEWLAEWKWDGIRAQLVRRAGATYLWSRGEELVTERFPEIAAAGAALADGTVLDGEILPWRAGVLPFAQLQTRIGRKTLADVPVVFLAYDLLEQHGQDLRTAPQSARRAALETLINTLAAPEQARIQISPIARAPDWATLAALREHSRARNVEGLMLKRLSAPYRVGRVRGDWWKWKIDPYTIDAVLVYAQRGSGKRASLGRRAARAVR
jgi:DNA ligase 1